MADTLNNREIALEKTFIEKANKVIPGSDKGVDTGMSNESGAGAAATKGKLAFETSRSDGIGLIGEDGLEGLGDIKGEDSPTPDFDTDLPGLSSE